MNSSPRPSGNVLAIDVGQHKIGLAVGDRSTGFAFPRPSLRVQDWADAWAPLTTLIKDEHIGQIVIGLPINTDGTTGPQAEQTRVFGAELQQRVAVPIDFHDERFSSQAVQHQAQSVGQPATDEDSQAAQLILEAYLPRRSS